MYKTWTNIVSTGINTTIITQAAKCHWTYFYIENAKSSMQITDHKLLMWVYNNTQKKRLPTFSTHICPRY